MCAPAHRIWPTVALGVPLRAGLGLSAAPGRPVHLPAAASRVVGTVLVTVFGVWERLGPAAHGRDRTVLLPEECYLTEAFGAEYETSRARVCRWL